MNSARVAAVVVAFYPDPVKLNALLGCLGRECVHTIYVVDNTPEQESTIDLSSFDVQHIRLGTNAGIASAHNVGIQQSISDGHSHVILFDQDSRPPAGMVAELLQTEARLLERGESVAAVGPAFTDVKSGVKVTAIHWTWHGVVKKELAGTAPAVTDCLIASGALIRTSVFRAVGGMIDALFIDWVDIEWSLRAQRLGYRSFIAPAVVMSHSIGDRSARIAGRHFNVHSDFRKYHIIRNAILLGRLSHIGVGARVGILSKALLKYVPAYLLISRNRKEVALTLLRAIQDALRARKMDLNPRAFT